jgi:RimJ/RimL family protein N-acetyltransferase
LLRRFKEAFSVTIQATADEHWASRLRCPSARLNQPGHAVLADAGLPMRRIVLFQHARMTMVRVHPSLADRVTEALASLPASLPVVADDLAVRLGLIPEVSANLISYLDPTDFRPVDSPTVRELTGADRDRVVELNHTCTQQERERSEVWPEDPVVFGSVIEGQLVAAGSFRFDGEHMADVGVVTHPEFRGRGLGRAVVAALCRVGLAHERLMQYSALAVNLPSQRLARRLGFRVYAVEEAIWVA